VVPGGGLSADGKRWIGVRKATYLLPVNVLRARFRTLLCQALRKAAEKGGLARLPTDVLAHVTIEGAAAQKWVVYAKPPFGGPRQVLEYLSRYTHRVAISNRRIVSFTNGRVTFAWRDYRDGNRMKESTIDAMEFVRRFLLHVLPDRFVRIRYFGFLTNARRRHNIEQARELVGCAEPDVVRERPKFRVLCPECMAIVYGRNPSQSSDLRTDRSPPFIEDAA
jgi:hypothetical protein